MKRIVTFFTLICLLGVNTSWAKYKRPQSNSRVSVARNLTQYWTIDTTRVFKIFLHLNTATLIQFPVPIKMPFVGNTAEIKVEKHHKALEIKPLLGATHSNIHVHLHSGEIVNIELWTRKHGRRTDRVVFLYPNHDPIRDLKEKLNADFQTRQSALLKEQRDALWKFIPDESVKNLIVHRISSSRKSTRIKYQGYLVTLDFIVSNKNHTFFAFSTNAKPNEPCPITSVKKVELKDKGGKNELMVEEFLNTGNRVIIKCSAISEKGQKGKVFFHLNFYGKTKILKVKIA